MRNSKVLTFIFILTFIMLPFGNIASGSSPGAVPTAVTYSQIELGYDTSCAVTSGKAGVCWGINEEDTLQLGVVTPEEYHPFPIRPTGFTDNIIEISSGDYHSCAITENNETLCWGDGYYGALGDGLTDHDGTPTAVINFPNPGHVSAGAGTTCGITSAGVAYCWGNGYSGQMGNGTNTGENLSPVPVSIGTLSKISVGSANQVCAITSTGAAFCWGADTWGQLGNGSPLTASNLPVQVSGLGTGTMQNIASGGIFTCGLTVGGGVKCWGYNGDGELGNNSTTNSPSPVDVSGLTSGVSAIAAGAYHSCAILSATGAVKCWGHNGYGQIGDGTSDNNRLIPTAVEGLTKPAVGISAGGNHTCALLNDGSIQCWGKNYEGQLGIGTNDPDVVTSPVEVINEIGSIFGNVSYSGSQPGGHKVFVSLHLDTGQPPVESTQIYVGDLYGIAGLPDGSYYIGAFLDVDNDGGGPPDAWEPSGWYDGPDAGDEPDLVSIVNGANLFGYDITLLDPGVSFSVYLPLTLR